MQTCQPELLRLLVEQTQEPSIQDTSLLDHLKDCRDCQKQLNELGGAPELWDEMRRSLREFRFAIPDQASPCDDDHRADEFAPPDLSFLLPPQHPEMLGRLDRYDIEGFIGAGGMGIVLRAFDTDLQRTVAIKVLANPWSRAVGAKQRFAREAQAAASIAHENVVPIFHVQAEHDPPYIVMPYIPSITLKQYVTEHHPLPPATILRIAHQVIDGLAAAHAQGLVHRDITPSNVLIGHEVERVWITDFGLARGVGDATLSHSCIIAGTPHFMSPEQIRGERVDHRSDWFSLGALLYFLASSKPPFDGELMVALLHKIVNAPTPRLELDRKDLPHAFIECVEALLQKRVDSRPNDPQQIRTSLQLAMKQLELGMVGNPKRYRKMIAFTVVSALLALVCSVGIYVWWNDYKPHLSPSNPSEPVALQQPSLINPNTTAVDETKSARELAKLEMDLARLEARTYDDSLSSLPTDGLLSQTSVESKIQELNQDIKKLEYNLRKTALTNPFSSSQE